MYSVPLLIVPGGTAVLTRWNSGQRQEGLGDADAPRAYAWTGGELRAGTRGNVIGTRAIACGKVRDGASLQVEGRLAL